MTKANVNNAFTLSSEREIEREGHIAVLSLSLEETKRPDRQTDLVHRLSKEA